MKGIVYSQIDDASKNIANKLLEKGFKEIGKFKGMKVYKKGEAILTSIKEDVIYPKDLDKLAELYNLELIVIASRHKSQSGIPTLSVHPTGNYGEAKYGGEPRTLQNTHANAMRRIFLQLLNNPPEGYSISLEATHHGPTEFRTPILFAEIGSSREQWTNQEAGEFLANAILKGLMSKERTEVAIGFGGNHYASKFSKMEEELAFGHICPKYSISLLDEFLIKQMTQKTVDGVDYAVFDEGGMKGREKSMIKSVLDKLGLEY